MRYRTFLAMHNVLRYPVLPPLSPHGEIQQVVRMPQVVSAVLLYGRELYISGSDVSH